MENLKQPQKKALLDHFTQVQTLYQKKRRLRKQIGEINGKILINKQIIEEAKRRNDENHLYYKDQIAELDDNVSKKASLVKQFQKKFSEVEIFIQRESQNEANIQQWGHWKTFTIVPFLLKNESLLKLKSYYDLLIENRVNKATELIDENKNIGMKKTINYTFSNEKKISNLDTLIAAIENTTFYFERQKEQFNILIEKITKSENKPKKDVIPVFVKINNFNEDRLETLPLNGDDNKNMTHGITDVNEEDIEQIQEKENHINEGDLAFRGGDDNDNWDISRIEKKI